MPDDIAYRLSTAGISLERLYAGEFSGLHQLVNIDTVKSYLSYLPRLEIEISC